MSITDMEQFKQETGLTLRASKYSNKYIETSGKKLSEVKNLIYAYNVKHDTNIFAYNDVYTNGVIILF